jgi:hypothetical protein
MEFPDFQSALGSTDDLSLRAVTVAPGGSPSTVGTSSGTIPIGGFLEVPLVVTQNPDGTVAVTLGQSGVTINSLIAELNSYCAAGAIQNPGEEDNEKEKEKTNPCGGLIAKVMAAKTSIDRGNRHAARNQLRAFQHELNADNLFTNPLVLQRLIADSQALISALAKL